MNETKTVKFSVAVYRDEKGGGMVGPNDMEVVITGNSIKLLNTLELPFLLLDGVFKDVSGNDSAIVLKIISKTSGKTMNHIVFVGMGVGSPFTNIATAKLAYVYF